jgi:hypothetical protein
LPAGGAKLGHDLIAIGDEHRLAGLDQAEVFAQTIFQNLDADGFHAAIVATGS